MTTTTGGSRLIQTKPKVKMLGQAKACSLFTHDTRDKIGDQRKETSNSTLSVISDYPCWNKAWGTSTAFEIPVKVVWVAGWEGVAWVMHIPLPHVVPWGRIQPVKNNSQPVRAKTQACLWCARPCHRHFLDEIYKNEIPSLSTFLQLTLFSKRKRNLCENRFHHFVQSSPPNLNRNFWHSKFAVFESCRYFLPCENRKCVWIFVSIIWGFEKADSKQAGTGGSRLIRTQTNRNHGGFEVLKSSSVSLMC